MAQQVINIGTSPNDSTGDTLRTSFTKTNANFTELYTRPLGNAFTSSLTAPSSPNVGDLWYDTSVGALSIYISDGNSLQWLQVAPGAVGSLNITGSVGIMEPQGRLTLSTAVMVATVSGGTVLYYVPYVGNNVPIYDGTIFSMMSFPGSLVCTLTDTTKNPAAIGASKVNDWFLWNDAGTLRLSHGVDWTDDFTRNASIGQIARVNGLWLNSQAIANGPGVQRGTYVGTTKSTAAGTIPWILGGAAVGGTAANLGVWNCYNRVNVFALITDLTGSYSYAGGWRMANASASMRASFVSGLLEEPFTAIYSIASQALGGNVAVTGVTYDTTVGGYPLAYVLAGANQSGSSCFAQATAKVQSLGAHFLQAMEWANTNATACSFFPTYATAPLQSGLYFEGKM